MRIMLDINTRQANDTRFFQLIGVGKDMKIRPSGVKVLRIESVMFSRNVSPFQHEPAPFPYVLTGISQDHQVALLGRSIAGHSVSYYSHRLPGGAGADLRGTTLVSEMNFNPSICIGSLKCLEQPSSGSSGS